MNKKSIRYILLAIIIGIVIGKYVFDRATIEVKNVMKLTNEEVYLMQYGVYSDLDNLNKNINNLKNYIYVKENDGYHVYIGVSKNEENLNKIGDVLGLTGNIYNKRVNIYNIEFIEILNQYDELIKQTDDNEVIINAQKQILSKYEELILNNE